MNPEDRALLVADEGILAKVLCFLLAACPGEDCQPVLPVLCKLARSHVLCFGLEFTITLVSPLWAVGESCKNYPHA